MGATKEHVLTTEPAVAAASTPRSTITHQKAAVFAGALVAAMFVVLAWGALRDAASAQAGVAPAATAKKLATRQGAGATAALTAAATAKPSVVPGTKGVTTPTAATAPARAGSSL